MAVGRTDTGMPEPSRADMKVETWCSEHCITKANYQEILINPKIFLDKKAFQEIKFCCSKYWGKHSLLSILMHESNDKSDKYIKEQLSENFDLIIDFLSRISCKVKFGSRQERGIIGLPHEIFGDFDEGTISKEDEHLLDNAEEMLTLFSKNIQRYRTRILQAY